MNYERIDDSKQFDGAVRNSHEARYRIAAGYAVPRGFVLDAGCGEGYGMKFFNDGLYLGIDKNPPKGNRFMKADFEDPNQSYDWLPLYDVFIGLEIIEHLNDEGVMRFVQLARASREWVIVSTPIVPNSNPYHKQQFTEEKMLAMFTGEGWSHYQTFTQGEGRTYGIFIFKRT